MTLPQRPPTDQLTYLIANLHRVAHNQLEGRLQEEGASVENWRILERLAGWNGYSMGELASAVLMNHPALTKMIDRMVSNGLVHRAPDPDDQRRVLVYATERGIALERRLRRIVEAHEAALRKALGSDREQQIETALTHANECLQSAGPTTRAFTGPA